MVKLIFAALVIFASPAYAVKQGTIARTTRNTWLMSGTTQLQLIPRDTELEVGVVFCQAGSCPWFGSSLQSSSGGLLRGWVSTRDVIEVANQCAASFQHQCRIVIHEPSWGDGCEIITNRVCSSSSEIVCDDQGNCSPQIVENCHDESHMECASRERLVCSCEPRAP